MTLNLMAPGKTISVVSNNNYKHLTNILLHRISPGPSITVLILNVSYTLLNNLPSDCQGGTIRKYASLALLVNTFTSPVANLQTKAPVYFLLRH